MRDLREAIRALRSTPIVTAAAVLTLALCLGANTALFSILDSLLLRTLPIRDPHGLVAISGESEDAQLMYPAWLAVRDGKLLDGAFAWANDGLSEVQDGETRPVRVIWASEHFFDTLGVRTPLGRTLDRADGPVAVISASFWRRRFGNTRDVLGRTITLDRVPFTVAGVADASFFGLEVGTTVDAILPLDSEPLLHRVPSRQALWPWLHVAGRVPAGRTLDSTIAALRAAQPRIRDATNPFEDAEARDAYLKDPWTLQSAASGTSRLRTRYGTALLTLTAITGLVLLVGCANIANLQLARAGARRYEYSVRAALGASRWQLMRPTLIESALLAASGTALGFAFARPAGELLVAQLATWATAPVLDLAPNARVVAVSVASMTTAMLLFGVAPGILAGRALPIDALTRVPARSRGGRLAVSEVLVALQMGVCVLLLVGAGLFIRSFAGLAYRDLGFDRRQVVVAVADATRSRVPGAQRLALFERIRDEAARLPGVDTAALSMATPLGSAGARFTARVSLNAADVTSATAPRLLTNLIGPGWFTTYGTRLRAGRDFTSADAPGSQPVAIVNEAFARRFFAGESPLGRTFSTTTPGLGAPSGVTPAIVGVVEDAAFTNVRTPVEPTVYRPLAQTASVHLLEAVPTICVSVRAATSSSPEQLRGIVAAALAAADRDTSISTVTVGAQLDASYVRERLLGILAGAFAVIGLLLGALGLYGVTTLWVIGRRRELAVRVALGADRQRITRLVFRRLALVAGCGLAIGSAAAFSTGRLIEGLLYGLDSHDPVTFALTAATLIVTCITAAWAPARRAARTEPMIVLREA